MGKVPDYTHNYSHIYTLKWFSLLRFRAKSYHDYKVVIYGVGQEHNHVMDWAGCNYHHGRLPDSPVFPDEESAIKWLIEAVEKGTYKEGASFTGHHSGEHFCSKGCNDREISGFDSVFFSSINREHDRKRLLEKVRKATAERKQAVERERKAEEKK